MADASTVQLSEPHPPKPASVEAFHSTLHEIKNMFHQSRAKWDEHEPEMYSRCHGHDDHEILETIDLEKELVQVRTAETAYKPLKPISSTAFLNISLELFPQIRSLRAVPDISFGRG